MSLKFLSVLIRKSEHGEAANIFNKLPRDFRLASTPVPLTGIESVNTCTVFRFPHESLFSFFGLV